MTRERGSGVTPPRVVDLFKVEVKIKGVRGLAREVGISPAIITRYMNGKVGEPTTATLQKLAAYFGVSVAWLRGYDLPRWIPCAEQLPDSDTTVMTFAPDSNEPVWPAYRDAEQWWGLSGGPITDAEITHWQPLPDPPEAQQ